MKILVDMGLAPVVADELRRAGHAAVHLHEVGLGRLSDREILSLAATEGRVVLTHDLDFSDLLAASGERLPSVVVFRLQKMLPTNVLAHAIPILTRFEPELTSGCVISVREGQVRVRLLPIPAGEK